MNARLHSTILLVMLLAGTVAGCQTQDEGPAADSDTGIIVSAVFDLADSTSDPERFNSMFTQTSVPTDQQREEYRIVALTPDFESVHSDGDFATVDVTVRNQVGDELAQVQWKFAKVDGQWKIEHAPLE